MDKWISGTTTYISAILKTLLTYRSQNISITFENTTKRTINNFLLAVGNAKFVGGGMKLIPSASPMMDLFTY
ncbi:hypothetical protein [Natranaerobius trueperi]|uniref:YegS/DAGK C-terminal domain-containing protein n=1 Tax=Natranaerobius trueperi TaxID=759412 RepID=A0A226C0S6_9FIRM|nr:hypothetical protein [Natranaerobius trueperi]OWZ84785.1 hypothetical protein CDO51_01845 [Natranaerobius trueperi]